MSILAFDFETYRDNAVLPLLGPCKPAANLKDPAKIAASIEECTVGRDSKLALHPATCRIVSVGYTDVSGDVIVTVCPDEAVERAALIRFWEQWSIIGHRPVGYNCIGFDLPVALIRSVILQVAYPHITLRKYGSPDCDDLMLDLSCNGMVEYKSLSFWAQRLGLDVPEDTTSGKDIAGMVEAGDWAGVEYHNRCDVLTTLALAKRLRPHQR